MSLNYRDIPGWYRVNLELTYRYFWFFNVQHLDITFYVHRTMNSIEREISEHVDNCKPKFPYIIGGYVYGDWSAQGVEPSQLPFNQHSKEAQDSEEVNNYYGKVSEFRRRIRREIINAV